MKARSNEPILLQECPVLVDGFFEAVQKQAEIAREASDQSLLYLNSALQEETFYSVGKENIPVHRESFSQANLDVNEKMSALVEMEAEKSKRKTIAIDLFCGSGNFSFGLKRHFDKLIGIESNPISIRLAKSCRQDIEWIEGRVERALQNVLEANPSIDFALLDPAREGALQACQMMAKSKIEKICYISCQLDSLIRDLTALVKKGDYQIDRWVCVDLMPQTKHIESFVSLSRRQK